MKLFIRVDCNFPTHPKTLRLARRAGWTVVGHLVLLWAWVSVNRPDGSLGGMTDEDIALAARYEGDAGSFVDALIEAGFLDEQPEAQGASLMRRIPCVDERGLSIHDWQENNQFFSSLEERRRNTLRKREFREAVGQVPKGRDKSRSKRRERGEREEKREQPVAETKASKPETSEALFDRYFWAYYPNPSQHRRKVRAPALLKWKSIVGDDEELAKLISADVIEQSRSKDWTKEDGQFIPLAATYLHQRRWERAPLPPPPSRERDVREALPHPLDCPGWLSDAALIWQDVFGSQPPNWTNAERAFLFDARRRCSSDEKEKWRAYLKSTTEAATPEEFLESLTQEEAKL